MSVECPSTQKKNLPLHQFVYQESHMGCQVINLDIRTNLTD